MKPYSHTSVLLNESIENLKVSDGKRYIDATLGGGGHTLEIVKRGGSVLGIDQDQDALEFVKNNQESIIKKQSLTVVKGNFRDIGKIARENGFEKVDGIIFDLGVSSHQLDSPGRGFSFKKDEDLDMRMDKKSSISALDIVNGATREQLEEILVKNGEVHKAKQIVNEIFEKRKKEKITTTGQLKEIVESVLGKSGPTNPATQVFQAIRVEVNGELEAEKKAIIESFGLVKSCGRIVVISFHSLEDRIAKQLFLTNQRKGVGKVVNKKPIRAGREELIKNRRSASAKMRVFEIF